MVNLLKLIWVLGKNIHDEMPIRQLSKESDIPYTTAHRFIQKNKNIFRINQKGNMKLVSLNIEDDIIKNYLIIAERQESENITEKLPQIKIIREDLPKGDYALLLFGSRAEGSNRKKSDIDLCIINKKGEHKIKFARYELLFKLEVNPICFKDNEFAEMLKDYEQNVGKEILKKHVILHGEEYFWNLVWKNGILQKRVPKVAQYKKQA